MLDRSGVKTKFKSIPAYPKWDSRKPSYEHFLVGSWRAPQDNIKSSKKITKTTNRLHDHTYTVREGGERGKEGGRGGAGKSGGGNEWGLTVRERYATGTFNERKCVPATGKNKLNKLF